MATKITNSDDGWRVRMLDGEYDLSVSELGQWILDGRVGTTQDVRPPTTKRWEHATNCLELQRYFTEKNRMDAQVLWDAQAPVRAATEVRTAKAKTVISGIGCSLGLLGLVILFVGSDLGVAFGIGLGAVGLIVFVVGRALQ